MDDEVFIGRQRELAVLAAEFERAATDEARVLVVEGEAGVGKTALVRRFLASRAGEVLHASADEAERDLPFAVLDQLASGAPGGARPALTPSAQPGTPIPDPMTAGAALVELFGGLQGIEPLTVVVDDLHWADLPSVQALSFAVRRLGWDRVLVVLIGRTEELDATVDGLLRVADSRGTRVRLEGITSDEVVALAGAMGAGTLSPAVARSLHAQTNGNPLYAAAVLGEHGPDGLVDLDRAHLTTAPLPAPRDFARGVESRLDACSTDAECLVSALAVLGLRAPLGTVARVSGLADPVPGADDAATRRLVETRGAGPGLELAFAHPLIRSAAYHRLPVQRRRDLHLRAAAALSDRLAVLQHRVQAAPASDDTLAAELEQCAADEAARGSASSAAWALLAASRLSSGRVDSERRTLQALEYTIGAGDGVTAARLATEIGDFADGPRRKYVLGLLSLVGGRPTDAEALLRGAWNDLAPAPPDETRDSYADPALADGIAGWLVLLLVNAGRSSEAAPWSLRIIERTKAGVCASSNTSTAVVAMAATGGGAETLALVGDLSDRPDVDRRQSGLFVGVGVVHAWMDSLEDARRGLERTLTVARKHGPLVDLLISAFYLGDVAYRLGRWDDAVTYGELAVSTAIDAEQAYVYALVHGVAAFPLSGRGEWQRAEDHVRASVEAADVVGDLASRLWAAMAAGRLAHARRDAVAVAAAFEPLLASEFQDGLWNPGVQPWHALYAEALVELGRLDEAAAMVTKLEDVVASGPPGFRAGAARARGLLEAALGHDERAEVALRSSVDQLSSVERRFLLARNALALGEFLRRRGQRRAAAESLSMARDGFAHLGAAPYLERVEPELRACGLTPARRTTRQRADLTPQEVAVANLVAQGMSNREAATRLVVSVKTIEYHLGNAYTKLGVRSRSQLTRLMLEEPATA
jgi:DNA-binding CsgD family transcriptional regulator